MLGKIINILLVSACVFNICLFVCYAILLDQWIWINLIVAIGVLGIWYHNEKYWQREANRWQEYEQRKKELGI